MDTFLWLLERCLAREGAISRPLERFFDFGRSFSPFPDIQRKVVHAIGLAVVRLDCDLWGLLGADFLFRNVTWAWGKFLRGINPDGWLSLGGAFPSGAMGT